MARWLNKKYITLLMVTSLNAALFAQMVPEVSDEDYKNPKTHENFKKRREAVSSWQINQLKNGALVVRLKTNQTLIDELRKSGKTEEADQKEAEQYLINQNIVRAFNNNYKFSKVYFIFSNSSDALLKGNTSGIFVDSTLRASSTIAMTEDFYLLAERDYVYNSSIGFVPEDSAAKVVEAGNPTREMAIVLKNKYGHQLKAPFPYFIQDRTFSNALTAVPTRVRYKDKDYMVSIPKTMTYEKFAPYVEKLDEKLATYHRKSPAPDEMKNYSDHKPFFY